MKFCIIVSCLFFSSVDCTPPHVRSLYEIACDELDERRKFFQAVCASEQRHDYKVFEKARVEFIVMVHLVDGMQQERRAALKLTRWVRQQLERRSLKKAARQEHGLCISFDRMKFYNASRLCARARECLDPG